MFLAYHKQVPSIFGAYMVYKAAWEVRSPAMQDFNSV